MVHLMFTQAILIIPFSANKQQLGVGKESNSFPFCTLIMKKEALFPYRKGLLSDHACTLLI
ncbi:hypothetical protein AYJ08_03210 [Brevibacillus sp. SKDU10]|uniref:Uncharacterized protein n=1 Tax=Brevibacillus laterosporus TaxID=1465 RepID=A0A0F7BZK9_BRELA|nr:hypothetical protein EX87_10065 [Brevibacillus laterosporus]OAJ75963.1 hypothetical protein AYJ08_03210 [Brevibacillus sp. SKDU10]